MISRISNNYIMLFNKKCNRSIMNYVDSKSHMNIFLQVSMTFKGNRAATGPVIYASDVDVCEWFDASSPFFEEIQESWTFMDLRDNYILRGSDELDVPDYYIQTVAHTIRLAENEIIVSTHIH